MFRGSSRRRLANSIGKTTRIGAAIAEIRTYVEAWADELDTGFRAHRDTPEAPSPPARYPPAVTMPATRLEIVDGIHRILTAEGPQTEDHLVAALKAEGLDLGVNAQDTVADLLESDEVGLVMPLGDGRHAWLPALLLGRTFTHRVSPAEIEHGFLDVSPDLEPLSLLTEDETYLRLIGGTRFVEVLAGFDGDLLAERGIPTDSFEESAWLLDPAALRELKVGAGDLVGVTVRKGGFELTRITSPTHPADARPILDALTRLRDGEPDQIDSVIWLACADQPGLFASPTEPLTEIFRRAGLVTDGEQVAPPGFDFARWSTNRRIEHIADVHQLDDDSALAVLVLSRLYERVADFVEQAWDAQDGSASIAHALTPTAVETDPGPAPDSLLGADRRLVRDLAERLEDPAVAKALLVETIGAGRDGAAALGLFAETLEPQVAWAARPAVRWLLGKAHERLGEAVAAEAAYDAALSMDADSPLALFELARIASDRGDAERGLSLLRRAGAPVDDDLVVLLTHFRPTERRDLGRNDPCWCGSGRKYKVCHRNHETLPLTDRAAWLYQKAGTYLADGPWRGNVVDVAEIRAQHWDQPGARYLATQDPLVCDTVLFEGGAFEAFLTERGGLLPDDELLLAEQWLLTDRSVHEIETVSPGSGFIARDVRTGERVEVRERTASRTLQTGMLICARLVPAGDTVQCFGGLEAVALHQRDGLLELLDSEPDPAQLVAFLSARFAPPDLQNTEGEPLVLCSATLSGGDMDAFTAALDTTYDRVEDELRWIEHVTTLGMERIRATITIEGAAVHVETNSEPRMDRVLDTLLALQKGLQVQTQTRRPAEDLEEAISRAPAGVPISTLDPNDPAVAAVLEQFTRTHEHAWLDEPIPALSGVTPREAAADPTRRPDLIRLLDSFGPAAPGTMDPDRLRAQLGL